MCEHSVLASSSHFLIRSKDRENFWQQSPSDFRINLSKPLKGKRAQLVFCQLPVTYYNITQKNNQINVNSTLYTVPIGCYDLISLMSVLQNVLTPQAITVTFDSIASLINFSSGVNFTMNFNITNSISKVVGFSPLNTYSGSNNYNGTYPPKLFDNCIYISTNFTTGIQTTSNLKNVSFVIPHNVNKDEIIQFYSSTQFALQPHVQNETIGTVEIRVFNEDGDLLQGLGEWGFMMQIV